MRWSLSKTFLRQSVRDLSAFTRSSGQPKLPLVLTRQEVPALLEQVPGVAKLLISRLYGSGFRRIELVRLRVKDIDFDLCQLQVWHGKGGKHRAESRTHLGPTINLIVIDSRLIVPR